MKIDGEIERIILSKWGEDGEYFHKIKDLQNNPTRLTFLDENRKKNDIGLICDCSFVD